MRLYCQGLIDCCFQAKNICILIIVRQRPHWFMSTFVCTGRSSVIRSPCLVLLRPLVDQIDSVWRGKCHRVQSEHTLVESEDVLFTVVVPGP